MSVRMVIRVVLVALSIAVAAVVVGVVVSSRDVASQPPGEVSTGAGPARIVSLAPSVTETLFALGVGEKVVGVTEWCDYPPEARTKRKVGGYNNFSVERVVALSPDLVTAAHGISRERLQRLEALGIRVFAEDPRDFNEAMAQILRLGTLVGAPGRAREIVTRMLRDIDEVTSRVAGPEGEPRPRVMYTTSFEAPLFVAGPGNFIDEAIRLAGGVNIAADAGTTWPVGYSIEKIVAHDPEIIISGTGGPMGQRTRTLEMLRNDPVWKNITAVKAGQVYWIDENLLVRPGPRLTEGLKELARCIHPRLFAPTETQP